MSNIGVNPADLIQFSEQELVNDPQYSAIFRKTRRGKVIINDIIEQRFGQTQYLSLASPFDQHNQDLVSGIRNPELLPLLGNQFENRDQVNLVQTANASFNKKINQFNTVFGPEGGLQQDILQSLIGRRGADNMPVAGLRNQPIVAPARPAAGNRRRRVGDGNMGRALF
jgi:hypothetical protein